MRVDDVDGSSASSSRVCSGLCFGGAGAFLLLERRFRSKIGPRPLPPELVPGNTVPDGGTCDNCVGTDDDVSIDDDDCDDDVGGVIVSVDTIVDVDAIAPDNNGTAVDIGVVIIVCAESSPGVLTPDESYDSRLINSVIKSSMRPILCCSRCISRRTSTFKSKTVAKRSR